jgi:hypothetical protein
MDPFDRLFDPIYEEPAWKVFQEGWRGLSITTDPKGFENPWGLIF